MMKLTSILILGAATVLATVNACSSSSSDDTQNVPTAGSGSGGAGNAGNAGSGSAGKLNTAGKPETGDAGTAGEVGSAGATEAEGGTAGSSDAEGGNADAAGAAGAAGSGAPVVPEFLIGGAVTGVQGSGLSLHLDSGDDVAINADGTFHFTHTLAEGAAYTVTITAQPVSPWQTCTISEASGSASGNSGVTGTVGAGNILDIDVSCKNTAFTVSAVVSGLLGSGLVLRDNGGDDLTVAQDGSYDFATPVASAAPYDVSVVKQPLSPTQLCTVTAGSGNVLGTAIQVAVQCAAAYVVGGTVTGLGASAVVLQDDRGQNLSVASNSGFSFTAPRANGASYTVQIATQPSDRVCSISGGSGVINGADAPAISVTCTLPPPQLTGTFPAVGQDLSSGGGYVVLLEFNQVVTLTGNGSATLYDLTASTSTVIPSASMGQAYGPMTVLVYVDNGASHSPAHKYALRVTSDLVTGFGGISDTSTFYWFK